LLTSSGAAGRSYRSLLSFDKMNGFAPLLLQCNMHKNAEGCSNTGQRMETVRHYQNGGLVWACALGVLVSTFVSRSSGQEVSLRDSAQNLSSGQQLSLSESRNGASSIDWKYFKQLPSTNCSCGEVWVSNLDLAELKSLATKGNTPSQCLLARLFYTGKQGLLENKVEADKWALIASAKAESARALAKEFELFMSADQIKSAKEAAARFVRGQKTQ
jgi:hypothetical protein